MLENVSIIIPVAPNESRLQNLLAELDTLNTGVEILMESQGSRAKSLNTAARNATREFLWFLHADCHVDEKVIEALRKSIEQKPSALHYFNLGFLEDNLSLSFLNAFGANLRSKIFGTPFGDQGFCISRKQFERVGGYPEDVSYGEDHLFVWHARQNGIRLKCTGEKLYTSARKYKEKGWLKLTLSYQYLWIKQAFPEWFKLLGSKLRIVRY